eukprot:GHVU01224888.1.p1 GENE.GHVU01224888.1~~GHVU01224888.1.p1  ORF type:complete len:111 (-),score=12.66 GHVU01224888.1:264-596(-)
MGVVARRHPSGDEGHDCSVWPTSGLCRPTGRSPTRGLCLPVGHQRVACAYRVVHGEEAALWEVLSEELLRPMNELHSGREEETDNESQKRRVATEAERGPRTYTHTQADS